MEQEDRPHEEQPADSPEWNPRWKTPEELKEQFHQADMHRKATRGYPLIASKKSVEKYTESPQQYVQDVEQERQSGEQFTDLSGGAQDYVSEVRSLRRKSTERIKESMSDVEMGKSRADHFIETVTNYNSDLAATVLERLQKKDKYIVEPHIDREYTDQEIQEMAKDPQSFEHAMERFLYDSESMHLFIDNFDLFQDLLPADRIQDHLRDCAAQGISGFVFRFDTYRQYFPEEEHKPLLEVALRKGKNSIHYFGSYQEREHNYFTQDEVSVFIQEAFENASMVRAFDFEKLLKRGYLSEEDCREIILQKITKQKDMVGDIENLLRLFPGEYGDSLKHKVVELFLNEDYSTMRYNTLGLSDFAKVEKFLAPDDIQVIVYHMVEKAPEQFFYHIDLTKKYLTHEELSHYAYRVLQNTEFVSEYQISTMLREGYVSPEQARPFLLTIINHDPVQALYNLEFFSQYLSEEEINSAIRTIAEKDFTVFFNTMDRILPMLTSDPSEYRSIIEGSILDERSGFNFVTEFNNAQSEHLFRTLFTKDDIQDLMYKKMEVVPGKIFYYGVLKGIRDFLGSDAELKNLVDQARKDSPGLFMGSIDQVHYLYKYEFKELIQEMMSDEYGAGAVIDSIKQWGNKEDFTAEFLWDTLSSSSAYSMLYNLPECLSFISDTQKDEFLKRAIAVNPPLAIAMGAEYFSRHNMNVSQNEIVDLAYEDAETMSFVPRTLNDFYEKVRKSDGDSMTQTVLKDAHDIYIYIGRIKEQRLVDQYRSIVEHELNAIAQESKQQQLTERQERDLLSTMYCFSIMKQKHPNVFSTISLGRSIDESKQILFDTLYDLMEIEKRDDSSRERFLGSMESVVPFMTYYLQHESSAPHKQLLSSMMEHILDGAYREWKYGDLSEESFIELQDKGLLPQNLSPEQYTQWVEDQDTRLFDSLSSDTTMVASSIAEVIIDNIDHLDVHRLTEYDDEPDEILKHISGQMSELGQRIAALHKEKAISVKIHGPQGSHIDAFTHDLVTLEHERSRLMKERLLIRLISLRPQEVASGRLLEGEDLKKQGERLEQVILKLQQVIPEEGQFVLSRIRGVLEDYHNQTDEKQNLLCTDSSDPKVTLEVGENPVGSCQSYATGSENKCLLGYTDPNSKVLVLRNERGKIVARSIFRLLSTPQGDPSLHVERIYSSIASSGVDRALYTHAMKKAKQMNVPLYISSQAQDENGISSEVLLPDGMQTEPVDYSLLSHTSRAPFVYVDSAGGRRSWGKYEVKNIVKVNESASIADI